MARPTIVLFTSNGLASYSLLSFADPRPDASLTGLLYSNTTAQYCTVQAMSFGTACGPSAWNWQVTLSLHHFVDSVYKAEVSCNTSAGQFFVVETSFQPLDPSIFRRNTVFALNPSLAFWMDSIGFIQEGVRELVCATNVSSFSLQYREIGGTNPRNTFQSIAYGNWSLLLQADDDLIYLGCDAYGFVDNLAITNLDSESNVLNEIAGLFEILYWLYLADFGQISPTVYPLFGYGDLIQPEPSNFAKVEQLPPTYNVFVNSSRYEMLSTWTMDFIQYVGGSPPTNITNAPLFNDTNGLPLQPN